MSLLKIDKVHHAEVNTSTVVTKTIANSPAGKKNVFIKI